MAGDHVSDGHDCDAVVRNHFHCDITECRPFSNDVSHDVRNLHAKLDDHSKGEELELSDYSLLLLIKIAELIHRFECAAELECDRKKRNAEHKVEDN